MWVCLRFMAACVERAHSTSVCPCMWTCVCVRVFVCGLCGVRQGVVAVGLVYVVGGLKVRGERGGAWVRSGASSLQHHSATWLMAQGTIVLSLNPNLFSSLALCLSLPHAWMYSACCIQVQTDFQRSVSKVTRNQKESLDEHWSLHKECRHKTLHHVLNSN